MAKVKYRTGDALLTVTDTARIHCWAVFRPVSAYFSSLFSSPYCLLCAQNGALRSITTSTSMLPTMHKSQIQTIPTSPRLYDASTTTGNILQPNSQTGQGEWPRSHWAAGHVLISISPIPPTPYITALWPLYPATDVYFRSCAFLPLPY